MLLYTIRRLGGALATIVVVSMLVFGASRLAPGDPALLMLGPQAVGSPALVAHERERLGLNKPVPVQYAIWLENAVQGDFGRSYFGGQSALRMVWRSVGPTAELLFLTLTFSVVIGVTLGVIAAARVGGWTDRAVSSFVGLAIAVPNYWIGLLLILACAVHWHWLPASGYVPIWDHPLANLRDALMPVAVLSVREVAVFARFAKAEFMEVLGEDYIINALALGAPPARILRRHAIKNGLIPVVTIFGIEFGALIGGVVIVEQIFSWAGVGWLSLQAVLNRDYAVIETTVLLVAVAYAVVNLVVDLLYAYLDPRIHERMATAG